MADGSMALLCEAEALAQGRVAYEQLQELSRQAAPHLEYASDWADLGVIAGRSDPPHDPAGLFIGLHPEDRKARRLPALDGLTILWLEDSYDTILGWGVAELSDHMRQYLSTIAQGVRDIAGPVLFGYLQVWDGADSESSPRVSRELSTGVAEWLNAPMVPYRVQLVQL